MASFEPTANGKWRVYVTVNYKRKSKTFRTKGEANKWAVEIENQMEAGGVTQDVTLRKLLEDYRDKVSAKKASERWETLRINAFLRDYPDMCDMYVGNMTKRHWNEWRNSRLEKVAPATVAREMTIYIAMFNYAIDEWEIIKTNPMKGSKKPAEPPPRDRLFAPEELSALLKQLGYSPQSKLETVSSRVGACLIFAIETAMRAQEICNLTWPDIKGRVASIRKSKTRSGIREVPLSPRALELIAQCKLIDSPLVFGVNKSQVDSLFRKAKKKLGIEDLTFHDSRHEGITRLAKRFDVLALQRAVGHKNLNELTTYYNETAENLADKLSRDPGVVVPPLVE